MATSRPSRSLLALAICVFGCSVPKPNFNDGGAEQDSCAGGVCGARGIASVAVGEQHTCVAFTDGAAVCFGNAADGRIGGVTSESPAEYYLPVPVLDDDRSPRAPLGDALRLVAGDEVTCAIRMGGEVACWGSSLVFSASRATARAVQDEAGVLEADLFAIHGYLGAAVRDGVLRTAGLSGRLGRPDGEATRFAGIDGLPAGARVAEVAVGGSPDPNSGTTLVRTDGQVWCFGDSALALCGDSGEIVAEATQISGLRDVSHICLGDRHACAASGGRVFCWGDQADGRLGNGATSGLTAEPVTFSAPWSGEVEALVCGSRDTLVVTNDGSQVWGWGRNDGSELGFGGPVLAPRQLAAAEGGARYEAYAGGHVCLVRRAPDAPDELLCAGRNNFGQLGLPGSASRDVLTPVPDLL